MPRGPGGCGGGWVWQAVGVGPGSREAGVCLWPECADGLGHQREAAGLGEQPTRRPLAVRCVSSPARPDHRGEKVGGAKGGMSLASPAWPPTLGGKPPACGHRGGPVPRAPNPGQPGLDGGVFSMFMAGLKRAEQCASGSTEGPGREELGPCGWKAHLRWTRAALLGSLPPPVERVGPEFTR